jgi:hypothetical protein
MAVTLVEDEIEFGDMNGPLAYWGPSTALRPHPVLSIAEQALLLRLRDRLEGRVPGTVSLAQALDALLEITADVPLAV